MSISCYEHLTFAKKKELALVVEEQGVFDHNSINQEITRVMSRRKRAGESLELSEVVKEVCFAVEAEIPESFRLILFQFVSDAIL